MSQISSADATKFCEDILRQGIRYNVEHHILPSENLVAERLLDRGVELVGAYAELCEKLANRPGAVKLFLGTLLSTAAFWKPSDISKAREGRKRLGKVNEEIAYHAARLGHLIAERDELHNHSRFASDTHFHVCEIIAAAAEDNYLFKVHVQERLDALHSQFDMKYWPSLSDFMWVIAHDARDAEIDATDPLTAAAATGPRSSQADFLKALYAAIEDNSGGNFIKIPSGFRLTDNSIASLATCALDLEPDRPIDGAHIKRFRQRVRKAAKQG